MSKKTEEGVDMSVTRYCSRCIPEKIKLGPFPTLGSDSNLLVVGLKSVL
jgi:hypothetical protein